MKNWTILIYANGNNELEPEVYRRFQELKNLDTNNPYNIIVEIGRADIELVKTLRSNIMIDTKQKWNGVRRYKIEDNQAILLENLGNINMAEPSTFVDFVSWGMKRYHNSRIMVIISGHGAGFVGVMTDYTQGTPYMMDINSLVRSLYKIKVDTKRNIDCLVLDACFMNMIEVWYEIASIPNAPVKYLLAPSQNIEIKGLSYIDIIKNVKSRITLRKSLIETTEYLNKVNKKNNLLLINLKKRYFNKLNREINYISGFISQEDINLSELLDKWCLSKPKEPLISILDLKEMIYVKYQKAFRRKKHIENVLNKIIIYPEISSIHNRLNQGPSLYLPLHFKQYLELRNYYDTLSFSKDNFWQMVISGVLPPPMEIPINYVAANIMDLNPDISTEELLIIINSLGWHNIRD